MYMDCVECTRQKEPVIYALSASRQFGERVGLNGHLFETLFYDGEPYTKPSSQNHQIRGRDVFIIQSLYNQEGDSDNISTKLQKLLLFCDAAYGASAGRITAVIPYLGFSRQDRKTEARAPISARVLAKQLEIMDADRVLTMDVHNPAIQGGYRIRTDFLLPFRPLVEFIIDQKFDLSNFAIIAPDQGAYKERVLPLEARLKSAVKEVRGYTEEEMKEYCDLINGLNVKLRINDTTTKSVAFVTSRPMDGKTLTFLVDDETSSGGSMIEAAERARDHGAGFVVAFVTHCKLNYEKAQRIQENSSIDRFVVTDTVCKPADFFERFPKFHEMSVAGYFRQAIDNIHNDTSVSALF